MSTSAYRDLDARDGILRSLHQCANECDYLANAYRADGAPDAADDLAETARRYRQLIAVAPVAWAGADQIDALCTPPAHDAETAACAAQDTEEIPRVR